MRNTLTSLLFLCATIAGCGGGGGGSPQPPVPPPAPATFTIGGTVSGLSGTGLVLQNNGAGNLTLDANGPFTFAAALAASTAYNVTIASQPTAAPAQTCAVADGTGTVSNAAVTNIAVTCRALTGKFVYLSNIGSNDVSGYAIDSATGALTELAGSPFPINGAAPRELGIDRTERFMYAFGAVNLTGPSTIAGYAIDAATGALTPIAGMTVIDLPARTGRVTFHPNGRFLYVPVGDNAASSANSGLYAYTIDATTGALTPVQGSPYTFNGGLPLTPKLSTNGERMYVPNSVGLANPSSQISLYAVNTTTGELTLQGSATTGAPINDSELHPGGSHLHTRNADTTNTIFDVDPGTGALSGPANAPNGWGTGIVFSRTGNAVYYATRQISPPPTPQDPPILGASRLDAYGVSGTTLTELANSPHPTSQGATDGYVMDPTGNVLVVTDVDGNRVVAFKIDAATGALTAVPGSPFTPPVGTNFPSAVAFDPSGRFAYLADVGGGPNPSTNSISAYSVDAAAGELTFIASYPTGDGPSFFPHVVGLQ